MKIALKTAWLHGIQPMTTSQRRRIERCRRRRPSGCCCQGAAPAAGACDACCAGVSIWPGFAALAAAFRVAVLQAFPPTPPTCGHGWAAEAASLMSAQLPSHQTTCMLYLHVVEARKCATTASDLHSSPWQLGQCWAEAGRCMRAGNGGATAMPSWPRLQADDKMGQIGSNLSASHAAMGCTCSSQRMGMHLARRAGRA